MIKQIVNSEEELINLIKIELESRELSNNQHGDNTDEELQLQIDNFIKYDAPTQYPVFLFAEFRYLYDSRFHDISLFTSSFYLSKEDMLNNIQKM